VCTVSEGAAWLQGCVDLHRPDAVRLVEFPQAVGEVAQAGQAVYGQGPTAFSPWFAAQRQTLHSGNPTEMLEALRRVGASAKRKRAVTALLLIQDRRHSVERQRGRLDYGWYQARGYPMGSGSVVSATKLVVERRLNGTGRP
jgi:hypothetical protein